MGQNELHGGPLGYELQIYHFSFKSPEIHHVFSAISTLNQDTVKFNRKYIWKYLTIYPNSSLYSKCHYIVKWQAGEETKTEKNAAPTISLCGVLSSVYVCESVTQAELYTCDSLDTL